MVLLRYLAMTAAEISAYPPTGPIAYMACQFSPYTEGLTNIPDWLPKASVLILNDRMPCQGHSADLVAGQLADAVTHLGCESILLDFQRPPDPESSAMVGNLIRSLPCPVAVTEGFAEDFSCPVFLGPGPLHLPLEEHLAPWKGREIWLEAALCQESVKVSSQATLIAPIFPTEQLSGGFYDEILRCHYRSQIRQDALEFTLFDTPESLDKKLEPAREFGVTRAVGLWQELENTQQTKKPLTLR